MKAVLIYLVLVGIPVAGVIGVLRMGRDIIPAPSVGGTWSATIRRDSACGSPAVDDTATVVVSQSGPRLDIQFSRPDLVDLRGRIYGTHFSVSGGTAVRLHAAKLREKDRMRGVIVGYPCPAARQTLLRAVRVAAPGQPSGH